MYKKHDALNYGHIGALIEDAEHAITVYRGRFASDQRQSLKDSYDLLRRMKIEFSEFMRALNRGEASSAFVHVERETPQGPAQLTS